MLFRSDSRSVKGDQEPHITCFPPEFRRLRSRWCLSCGRQTLVPNGAFWKCEVCEFAIASAALAKDSESTSVFQSALSIATVSGDEDFPLKTGLEHLHGIFENADQTNCELDIWVKGESSW